MLILRTHFLQALFLLGLNIYDTNDLSEIKSILRNYISKKYKIDGELKKEGENIDDAELENNIDAALENIDDAELEKINAELEKIDEEIEQNEKDAESKEMDIFDLRLNFIIKGQTSSGDDLEQFIFYFKEYIHEMVEDFFQILTTGMEKMIQIFKNSYHDEESIQTCETILNFLKDSSIHIIYKLFLFSTNIDNKDETNIDSEDLEFFSSKIPETLGMVQNIIFQPIYNIPHSILSFLGYLRFVNKREYVTITSYCIWDEMRIVELPTSENITITRRLFTDDFKETLKNYWDNTGEDVQIYKEQYNSALGHLEPEDNYDIYYLFSKFLNFFKSKKKNYIWKYPI